MYIKDISWEKLLGRHSTDISLNGGFFIIFNKNAVDNCTLGSTTENLKL
jgi:hypothetical protein